MPHLTLEYSDNLDGKIDIPALCIALDDTIASFPFFERGGIRVRAFASSAYAIADRHPANAFIDMQFRIGAGRSEADRKAAGDAIFATARTFVGHLLDEPHFALSLEIREIHPTLNWKTNSMHSRLRNKGDAR
ncbi:MAG: 5-carboxymethyl-2-hydroxymuconate Delta-isomerase [Mesorhizobium sp.]